MSPRGKKRLFDVLRIGVCAGALWIVLRGVTLNDRVVLADADRTLVGTIESLDDPIRIRLTDGTIRAVPREEIARDAHGEARIIFGLKTALQDSRKWLLALAVLIHLPVGLFQGIRLQWLLRAQHIRLGYWECIKLSYAGNFLNFATPLGSNAGDVFKAYFLTTHTDRKTEAATTVALDRAIGLGILVLGVAVITTFFAGGGRLAEFRPYVLTVLALGGAGAAIYLSPAVRARLRIPARWVERLPALRHVQRIDHTARSLAGRKKVLLGAVLATLTLQALAIGAYFTTAVALRFDAHWGNVLEYIAYFYTGAVVQALPGPPQGLGTVELAYRYFFDPYGSPAQILCLALLVRFIVLLCALPGLLVTVTGSYRPRPLPDTSLVELTNAPERQTPASEKTEPDLATT